MAKHTGRSPLHKQKLSSAISWEKYLQKYCNIMKSLILNPDSATYSLDCMNQQKSSCEGKSVKEVFNNHISGFFPSYSKRLGKNKKHNYFTFFCSLLLKPPPIFTNQILNVLQNKQDSDPRKIECLS